jgi:hypothetical protein
MRQGARNAENDTTITQNYLAIPIVGVREIIRRLAVENSGHSKRSSARLPRILS